MHAQVNTHGVRIEETEFRARHAQALCNASQHFIPRPPRTLRFLAGEPKRKAVLLKQLSVCLLWNDLAAMPSAGHRMARLRKWNKNAPCNERGHEAKEKMIPKWVYISLFGVYLAMVTGLASCLLVVVTRVLRGPPGSLDKEVRGEMFAAARRARSLSNYILLLVLVVFGIDLILALQKDY